MKICNTEDAEDAEDCNSINKQFGVRHEQRSGLTPLRKYNELPTEFNAFLCVLCVLRVTDPVRSRARLTV
jgi:hypothetical protein